MQGYLVSSAQLVAGIALLFFGGEFFVSGSVALSLLLGIPQIIIGLTIVAMGTSAPELFVSMLSTIQGNMGVAGADNIAVSNIVGSNIFNILIVLALSAVVFPLRVQSRLLRRELPLLLSISVAVWGMCSTGRVTWQSGIALLVGLIVMTVWQIRTASESPDEDEGLESEKSTMLVAVVKLAFGLALLVFGSQQLVTGASTIASSLGVSTTVIGLTIVSAGTSMPELVTSLVAARKGKSDLAIGNVIGSNLLNQLVILGLCATVSGQRGLYVDPVMITRDIPVMIAATLACLPICWNKGIISRREGAIMALAYLAYLTDQVLANAAPSYTDEYQLFITVIFMPAVLIFLAWQIVSWSKVRFSKGYTHTGR